MALKFGFFNSVDGDRKYTAADIGDYLRGIIYSGVYPDGTTSLQVLAAGGMVVEVQPGRAMLDFKYLDNDAAYPLTLSAGGTLDRIDAIVAYMDLDERVCGITVREGTPAASPVAPTMRRTDVRYEVMLASVYVTKLSSEITQANITDTRHNTSVCGWVRGAIRQETVNIPVPTPAMAGYIPHVTPDGAEYELLPTDTTLSFDQAVADAAAVRRYVDGKEHFQTVTLSASGWANNQQTVSVSHITADATKTHAIVAPEPSDDNYAAYTDNGVRCIAQAAGKLTFKCDSTPSVAIVVNVRVRRDSYDL